jgi:hypothetical protein
MVLDVSAMECQSLLMRALRKHSIKGLKNNHIRMNKTRTQSHISQFPTHTPTNVLDGEDDNHERFKHRKDGEFHDDLRKIREHMLMLGHMPGDPTRMHSTSVSYDEKYTSTRI